MKEIKDDKQNINIYKPNFKKIHSPIKSNPINLLHPKQNKAAFNEELKQ
jgi:hypothetical protein